VGVCVCVCVWVCVCVCVLIMIDTLLKRPSPHLSTLHFLSFKPHPTTLHYPLILLNPISISYRSTSPHITSSHFTTLHLTSLHCTFTRFSPHFYSFLFPPFTIVLLTLFLKIFGLQGKSLTFQQVVGSSF